MSGKRGFYSDIVVYDERNRYYYLWAQKNKPLLDDEVRNMGIGLLDQIRRGLQSVYGEVASPNSLYKDEYAYSFNTSTSFKVKQATDNSKNFVVTGGVSVDHPAVLYAKGFYIFLTRDIEYIYQTYPSGNIDLNTQDKDNQKTLTAIPTISTPQTDRIDIVYVSLKFAEVTAAVGTDQKVYRDSNLKNPIVGTETANRLRAVVDIKVFEDWSEEISKDIFNRSPFLGTVSLGGNPTDETYNIPIAAIYRTALEDTIEDSQIVDLLSLYSRRVCSLEELSYRITHGGYTQDNIADQNLSGFDPQFPMGTIDESAFAVGLNQGLDTEAFNSNSVTPRILDKDGRFMMGGVIAGDTGILRDLNLVTGSEGLNKGEIIARQISAQEVMIGYGETGITGMREYTDSLSIIHRGESGRNLVSISNIDGATGSISLLIKGVQGGVLDNYVAVDYDGRVGVNTTTPGHTQPDPYWNTDRYNDGLRGVTGVNIVVEVNGAERIDDHLFVGKDIYAERDMFGRTWKIPGDVSHETPMLVGFTGIPQTEDISDSVALVMVKRGIAVYGETGLEAYGYTGGQVAIEAFDAEGVRLFTIGDIGNSFDRSIKSLYGTSIREAYLSDKSLLSLPQPYGAVIAGDVIDYSIRLDNSTLVSGNFVLTRDGWAGIEDIRDHILSNAGFPEDPDQGITGMPYARVFTYDYNKTDGTIATYTGMIYGSTVVEDPFGYTGMNGDQHGRLIVKEITEGSVPIKLESVESFTVTRGTNDPISIDFIKYHYYGSGGFGGDILNIKFAKLDLGESSDGWLINGDVYFNGNGLLNRVTFSPNVIFRDDVFVYGTVYANEQNFNFANIQNLYVRNNLRCDRKGYFKEGASFGNGADVVYEALRASDNQLNLYVRGKGMAREMILRGEDIDKYLTGTLRFTNLKDDRVSATIGGEFGSTTNPFGIHIIDNRRVATTDKFNSFVIDFSDGRGNYSDLSLVISGSLSIGNYLKTEYMGIGPIDEINTDYRLQVNGRTLINDVLEVKALRFVGAEAPEGSSDIVEPSNVTVIGRIAESENGEEYQNNQIILREKKFTSTKRIYINNNSGLGYPDPGTSNPQLYYDETMKIYYESPNEAVGARWAFDNVSYLEDQFTEIVTNSTTPDEIIVEDITVSKYKKVRCERVRVASLGSLMIEWSGYKYDPLPGVPTDSCIQQYYFTSPYFRNRDGGINIDWYPEENRFGDDNFVVNVHADIIDTNAGRPSIYSIDKAIGLYIPKSNWWQYVTYDPDTNGYKSFAIFNPYENVLADFNSLDFAKQNSNGAESANWKLVLYPRLIKQNRVNVGTNLDKIYTGEWSLDLCILSEGVGKIANMVGKAYIGYYQS